ncbi:MAG TPA: hypothetical protein VI356_02800 [Myxococcales bacterium]
MRSRGGVVAAWRLKTFRCRVRLRRRTVVAECLAPTAAAAGYAICRQELEAKSVPWVQVVVSEWSGVLGEFIEPENVLIFSSGDAAPEGAGDVVFTSASHRREPYPSSGEKRDDAD